MFRERVFPYLPPISSSAHLVHISLHISCTSPCGICSHDLVWNICTPSAVSGARDRDGVRDRDPLFLAPGETFCEKIAPPAQPACPAFGGAGGRGPLPGRSTCAISSAFQIARSDGAGSIPNTRSDGARSDGAGSTHLPPISAHLLHISYTHLVHISLHISCTSPHTVVYAVMTHRNKEGNETETKTTAGMHGKNCKTYTAHHT